MMAPGAPAGLAQRDTHGPEGESTTVAQWFDREWPSIQAEANAGGWATFDFVSIAVVAPVQSACVAGPYCHPSLLASSRPAVLGVGSSKC